MNTNISIVRKLQLWDISSEALILRKEVLLKRILAEKLLWISMRHPTRKDAKREQVMRREMLKSRILSHEGKWPTIRIVGEKEACIGHQELGV